MNQQHTTPEAIMELLDIFEKALKDVSFPDFDLAILQEKIEAVNQQEAAVEEAQAALEKAQEVLREASLELMAKAKKGLAYAKVYADGNDDLTTALQAIHLESKKKGKKRKPKAKKETTPEKAPANGEGQSEEQVVH